MQTWAFLVAILWFPFISVPGSFIAFDHGWNALGWFCAFGFFEAPLFLYLFGWIFRWKLE